MPNTFEAISVLTVGAITIFSIMTWFAATADQRRYDELVEKTQSMPFTMSCASDGSVLPDHGRNCMEVPGYRLFRDGLGTVIAKAANNGTATVVFRRGTPDDIGSARELYEAYMAIRNNGG
jgi:hypothetical protein